MMDKDPQPSDTPPAESGPVRPEPVEGLRQPSLEDQLAETKAEAERLRNNWQRAEADFQNYKRRAEQERDENRRFALASLIINLLPILDDFERAFGSLDARLAGLTWFEGIYHIYRKLQQALQNAGVSAIEAEGQSFDPRLHEAVAHAEGEEGKVLAEVQRGYRLHDRVLRPAMVVVGKGKEPGTRNQEPGEEPGTGNKEQEG
ncbi:MAG: nucleotide exchange factor GrpE, partial [Chloroflexi bacterium]|nr:nucleotide exchange factor GrpE [Chloroflexota bacterium]